MKARQSKPEDLQGAFEMVRAYLRIALQPPRPNLDDLVCAAESVWNNHQPGAKPPPFDETGVATDSPAFQRMVLALHRARSERFGNARFFLFSLDYDDEGPDVVFRCDLMWTFGPTIHPFELRVPRLELAQPEWN